MPNVAKKHHIVKRSAFTFLELLVVIMIIALLLAIIIPSMRFALEGAKNISCQVNLRNICFASIQYYGNHDCMTIKIHPDIPDNPNACYPDILQEYYKQPENGFHCPIVSEETANTAKNGKRLDYGINNYGRPVEDDELYFPTLSGIRVFQVTNPDVIYFADSENNNVPESIGLEARGLGTDIWPIYKGFENTAYKRHFEGYAFVRLNGATGWYPESPSTQSQWYIKKK